jgi:hypothetical protein
VFEKLAVHQGVKSKTNTSSQADDHQNPQEMIQRSRGQLNHGRESMEFNPLMSSMHQPRNDTMFSLS